MLTLQTHHQLTMHPPACTWVSQPACCAMYNTASTCFMAASGVDVEMWDARSGAQQSTFSPVEQMIRMTKELNQVRGIARFLCVLSLVGGTKLLFTVYGLLVTCDNK